MDFLLECIGFPPSVHEEELTELVLSKGEPSTWRGSPDDHRTLMLGGGLEVRADRDPETRSWTLTPHYRVPHRLRVAITTIVRPPESPFDALITGWAAPPSAEEEREGAEPGAFRLSTWISDARRLDQRVQTGHVLALSVAGFAVHVERIIPNVETEPRSILERPAGAVIRPLGAPEDPGGCCDVSLRIREVRRLRNGITQQPVEIAVCDAPERPMLLFLSPWQLSMDGYPAPRPGWRVEGTFLFTGRIAGGLPKHRAPRFG